MSELVNKKKNKKWLLFVIIGVVAALIIAIGIFFISRAVKITKSNDEVSIGNKYLDELDYKQAIAHYEQAIEINPANLEAYVGIYNAYGALADLSIAELDFSHAVKYLDKAINILKDGREYITDGSLDEMIDDLHDRKKAAQAMRDDDSDISDDDDSADPGDPTDDSPDDSEEKTAALNNLLYSSSEYSMLLSAIATRFAHDTYVGYTWLNIDDLLSGDPLATAILMLPSADGDTTHSYSADWCRHYYSEDYSSYTWTYAIPLPDAVSGAYSITGQNVDFASYAWNPAQYGISVGTYEGEDCLIMNGSWAIFEGPVSTVENISEAEYLGDNTWKVTASINIAADSYIGLTNSVPYCDIDFYINADENSQFGFIITDCKINNVKDTAWLNIYNQFLADYKSSHTGTYSNYIKYDLLFINSDDIPELVISEGSSDAYYIYTIENNSLAEFICAKNPEYNAANYLYVASWVGGRSDSASYVPYASQILVSHFDQDYGGQVYYSYTEFFDGTNWTNYSESKNFTRDEYGNLGPDVQDAINHGYMSAEEYSYTYDVPGFDPNADWQPFTFRYSLDNFYY